MKGASSIPHSERPLLLAAFFLTSLAVGLIWSFRFLPLYDLPIWMYEVRLLHEAAHFSPLFEHSFRLVALPVPNLGVLGPLYLLSSAVDIETAAKVYLSVLVSGFPWAWRFAVRRIVGGDTAVAYLGFVYIFNLFFFGGQAYLMGIVLFLVAAGWWFPRSDRMSRSDWIGFAAATVVLYFVHAIAWALLLLMMLMLAFRDRDARGRTTMKLFLALLPSLLFACWYALSASPVGGEEWHWGLRSILQNVFKPLGLLVKSYGISTPFPLTLINVSWLVCLGVFLAVALRKSVRDHLFLPYALSSLVCILLALALPDRALGLYQPGARFVIPALFGIAIIAGGSLRSRWLSGGFLALSIVVCAYNAGFFSGTNQFMTEFSSDLQGCGAPPPMYSIGLDWPAGTGWWDEGSASINPLTLTPYYRYLDTPSVAWVHGTGLVRLLDDKRCYQPPLAGSTREEMVTSILENVRRLSFFRTLLIVGEGPAPGVVESALHRAGYSTVLSKRLWKILVRPDESAATGNKGE